MSADLHAEHIGQHDGHVREHEQHLLLMSESYWADAELDAEHWFSDTVGVTPEEAAMLLCHFNPGPGNSDYEQIVKSEASNGAVSYKELAKLKRRFEDLQSREPGARSLLDWLTYAQQEQLSHHPWADRYVHGRGITKAAAHQPTSPPVEQSSSAATKPFPRMIAQENLILKAFSSANLDPLDLLRQPPGKPGVKRQIREALGNGGLWTGPKVFDKAWERLLAAGSLRYRE